jgi:hypothetical protein
MSKTTPEKTVAKPEKIEGAGKLGSWIGLIRGIRSLVKKQETVKMPAWQFELNREKILELQLMASFQTQEWASEETIDLIHKELKSHGMEGMIEKFIGHDARIVESLNRAEDNEGSLELPIEKEQSRIIKDYIESFKESERGMPRINWLGTAPQLRHEAEKGHSKILRLVANPDPIGHEEEDENPKGSKSQVA